MNEKKILGKKPKAVFTNRILVPREEKLLNKLRKSLTYTIPPRNPKGKPIKIKSYAIVAGKYLSIPIGRTEFVEDHEWVDKRVYNEVFFPNDKKVENLVNSLRPSQREIYNKVNDNCVINAKPGWGKTYTAIAIATKLMQKTLIVVHTVKLRDQWKEEIKHTLGFEPGIIGSGKFNIDAPIVVANIQTLTKHIDKLKNEFGTLIVDEVHHCPATTFLNVISKSSARYKIGLSGTLRRKDGKHVLIFDYISTEVYTPPKENVENPLILVYDSKIKIPGNHMIPWATRVNELTNNPDYFNLVKQLAEAQADRGHTVLVLSDRVEFLARLAAESGERAICITSKVENSEELEQELREGKKDILYGSVGIYKEGISINQISCLVLAVPVNNEALLIQLVGRIIRKHKDKMRPEVIDIKLQGNTGNNQFRTRLSAYIGEGYEVLHLN